MNWQWETHALDTDSDPDRPDLPRLRYSTGAAIALAILTRLWSGAESALTLPIPTID